MSFASKIFLKRVFCYEPALQASPAGPPPMTSGLRISGHAAKLLSPIAHLCEQ